MATSKRYANSVANSGLTGSVNPNFIGSNNMIHSQQSQQADPFDAWYDRLLADNQASAQSQMDFQERMSSTAHQREVQDLLKAGLNPILSANNGASSPVGAYSTVDSAMPTAKLNAKLQNELTDKTLKNNLEINKMQIDASKAIAEMQAKYGLAGVKYSANSAYAASAYATDNPQSLWGIIGQLGLGATGNGTYKDGGDWLVQMLAKGVQSASDLISYQNGYKKDALGYYNPDSTTAKNINATAKKQAEKTLQKNQTRAKRNPSLLSRAKAVAGR